jgi:ATP-dependent Lhr-like helicase
MWGDDGIVVRLPEAADELDVESFVIGPEEIDELVVSSLPQTSLFAARFRECAGRALLLPRRRPDRRTPLWQQRQRAADLLAVASKYPSFPILLETSRECLQDVFDVPALREVLTQITSRRIRLVHVDTATSSPMASSLLFNWIAAYMYEGDAPLAERRAAALSLDRDLLRELLGAEELRELLDPGVLADVELELQCLTDGRRARTADELHDVLRKVGELSRAEVDLRCEGDGVAMLAQLVAERRAIELVVAGEARFAAADDAARYRDALGCSLPLGLPTAFTDPVPRPLEELVARFARTHGPFLAHDVARRFGAPLERVEGAIQALADDERLVRGEFRPDGVQREWCDPDVLRQLRRRSLATLRREIEPVEPEALARFLPAWHGIGGGRRGAEALIDAIGVLAGAPLVASTFERDLLPSRVEGYRATALDELCTSGEVVWLGAGSIGQRDGRIRLCFADQVAVLAPGWEAPERPDGQVHVAIRAALAVSGASFWGQVRAADPSAGEPEILAALWDLVWAGEVTNDSLAPLRAVLAGGITARAQQRAGRARQGPRPGRLARLGPPAGAGRWSLVEPLLQPAPSATEAAHAQALQLLERHGVVTREAVLAEGVVGGYASVYGVLKVLEERGRARRGYFVAGLGAAQFALPGAVDRLRSEREPTDAGEGAPMVLAATDPAQPYGSTLAWPSDDPAQRSRAARTAAAVVVTAAGVPLVWFDRNTHHLVLFPTARHDQRWAAALADLVRNGTERSVEVRKVDGEPVPAEVGDVLRAAGFADGYRGLVLRSP